MPFKIFIINWGEKRKKQEKGRYIKKRLDLLESQFDTHVRDLWLTLSPTKLYQRHASGLKKRRGGPLPLACHQHPGRLTLVAAVFHQPAGDADHVVQHALGQVLQGHLLLELQVDLTTDQIQDEHWGHHLAVPGHQAAELGLQRLLPPLKQQLLWDGGRARGKMRVRSCSSTQLALASPYPSFPFLLLGPSPPLPSLPFSQRRNARKPSCIISFPCVLLKCMLAGEIQSFTKSRCLQVSADYFLIPPLICVLVRKGFVRNPC